MQSARQRQVEAARGLRPLDWVLENIQLVNVYTQEVYPAEIGILEGVIVHVGPPGCFAGSAARRYDGRGQFALPGLVDSHVHIESSMMSPAAFAEAVIPRGTTTVVVDPHEIANVVGLRGVGYMLEATADLPLRVYAQAPSCVPAVPGLETAGAAFGPAEIREMLGWERVIGLAEVMNYVGVIEQDALMSGVVGAALEKGVPISGHAPGMLNEALSAYLIAGPGSDHESYTAEELWQKLRAGMTVEGRVSSFLESMTAVGGIVRQLGALPPNLVLCTDDIFPEDLARHGHVDRVVRLGIAGGMTPVQAICAGSLQGALRHRLHHLGALAPGKAADIVLVPDLTAFVPDEVFCGGQLTARQGKMLMDLRPAQPHPLESENTVHLPHPPCREDFLLAARPGRTEEQVHVLVVAPSLQRSLETRAVRVRGGWVDLTDQTDLCWVAVLERHGRTQGRSLGVARGLVLRAGAVASTVAHDSHNLVVMGRNAEDMAAAAGAVAAAGGGIAYARDGRVTAELPLPIGGLMSPWGLEEMVARMGLLNDAMRAGGMEYPQPLGPIFAMALPVIPDYGFTDLGLVDVARQERVPLWA